MGLSRQSLGDQLGGQPVEQLGMAGDSPRTPKSLGVATIPRPKWCCQRRLTTTRAVRGLSERVSQRARASASARGGTGGVRWTGEMPRRPSRRARCQAVGARPDGRGSSHRHGAGRRSRGHRFPRRPGPSPWQAGAELALNLENRPFEPLALGEIGRIGADGLGDFFPGDVQGFLGPLSESSFEHRCDLFPEWP